MRALVLLACVTLCGCAELEPAVKTLDQIAVDLCVDYYSTAKVGLSTADVLKDFCTTAEQIQPFLAAASAAEKQAAAVRGAQ